MVSASDHLWHFVGVRVLQGREHILDWVADAIGGAACIEQREWASSIRRDDQRSGVAAVAESAAGDPDLVVEGHGKSIGGVVAGLRVLYRDKKVDRLHTRTSKPGGVTAFRDRLIDSSRSKACGWRRRLPNSAEVQDCS